MAGEPSEGERARGATRANPKAVLSPQPAERNFWSASSWTNGTLLTHDRTNALPSTAEQGPGKPSFSSGGLTSRL